MRLKLALLILEFVLIKMEKRGDPKAALIAKFIREISDSK